MFEPMICFRKNENFVFRQIDEETILVPIKNNVGDMGCIYTLNEVGAFVWKLIDGHKTIEEIYQCLLKEFDVSTDKAFEDLKQFVNQLESIEAVVPNPGSA
jgi:Coenzyme PQQ synthesis protein D (PqqD)